ncbi:RNA polymerase II-associated protein Rtr1 [Schizosaccharomyces cryophilus OY26]|uniref:RNA polymerase II subunit B1 CTD phosphatase RPAP2 homolog n=1 Tax=Schizosaccharomyces cryophilus (strain OY26 / ATCC MYA-4695 / CBS 11777 / NBRC 106824 / NRRL Y48691) TaxID=653667 RepID=S9XC94_SCHCR|nr:RNA polymerase II-associated protein Rtr1 [Schizosaccharomyces cryophilus OY26]EPY51441.1 RNA polymerase II-associated protein Rtr1 [Schizosaccharomyces cryophilus OY26]
MSANKSILKKKESAQVKREAQLNEWSKDLLLEAKSRLEYDNFVLEWVEKLVDPVDEHTLNEAREYLKKSDYDQIVKERKLAHICGYPICNNAPRQQTRFRLENQGMVRYAGLNYYCSKDCFLKSCDFMVNLSDEPLWIRERARRILQHRFDPKKEANFQARLESEDVEHVRLLLQGLPVGSKGVVGDIVEHPPNSAEKNQKPS